jgi:NAD(P)H-dependent FMN reductase
MKLALIVGSPRPKSQSSRVAAYIAKRHEALFPASVIETIDLARCGLHLAKH